MAQRDLNAGFDSLLDTMTNAVGVLIIVLAVSYLTLRDTVDRVSKVQPVPLRSSIDQFRDLQAESDRLNKLIEQLRLDWKMVRSDDQYSRVRLSRIQEQAAALRKRSDSRDVSRVDIHSVTTLLDRDRSNLRRLEDEIDRMKQQIKYAQRTISLQREHPKPKVTIARVPDPVPAPRGALRLPFLCRYGRVVFYPTEEMLHHLHKGIADATKTDMKSPRLRMRDLQIVVDYFNEHEIGQNGLRWRIHVVQRVNAIGAVYRELRAILEWSTPDVGETLDEIQKKESKYQQVLTTASSGAVYAKYYVWGDSFPEYAVSREIADEYDIPAGWVAKEGDAEYQLVVMSTQTGKIKATTKLPQRTPVYMPVPRIGIGRGMGSAPSLAAGAGAPSLSIVGASPGGDFVD